MQARGVHGANQLSPEKGKPFWKLILKQFDDYLVKVSCQKYRAITQFIVPMSHIRIPQRHSAWLHSFRACMELVLISQAHCRLYPFLLVKACHGC